MTEPKAAAAGVNIGDVFALMKYAKYIPLVIQIVSAVQAFMGDAPNDEKHAKAKQALAAGLALVEGISEKDLANDAAFNELADDLITLGVDLMKLQPRIEEIAAHIRNLKPAA